VHNLPAAIDEQVASALLTHLGKSIDTLTPAQNAYLNNWEV
jgi:S-adenosylhomocysteine hydrolase